MFLKLSYKYLSNIIGCAKVAIFNIQILEQGIPIPVYVKALSYLIEKNQNLLRQKSTIYEKSSTLEDLWRAEFSSTLVDSRNQSTNLGWTHIEFSSEIDRTFFMLRWS